jgi:hypothetical protein
MQNSPESRKLANVSNLPTFATFVNGGVGKWNTNQQTRSANRLSKRNSLVAVHKTYFFLKAKNHMKLPVIKHSL